MKHTSVNPPSTQVPEGLEKRPSGGNEVGPETLPIRMSTPLTHLVMILVGFLLGVFLMIVLRSEIQNLTSRSAKLAIFMGVSVGLLALIYPIYRRLARALLGAFGVEQGVALLQLANFIIFVCGVLLVIIAGVYFVALV